jgi:hypothetical protein
MGCAAIFLYTNTIDFMNATVVTTVDTMTVPLSEVSPMVGPKTIEYTLCSREDICYNRLTLQCHKLFSP